MTILKPVVPGTVIRFSGSARPQVEPSAADTVAVTIVSDWGPVFSDPPGVDRKQGGLQEVTDFAAYTQLFGDGDTPGRTAVAGAFAGQGLPGLPGAGGVIVARMAGSGKAKSSVTINDTQGSPAPALRLDGKYYGSRANGLSYTIDVDPINATRDRLRLFFGGAVVESYSYLQTDVIGLTASINLRSKWVAATNLETAPHRLTAGSAALTGGNDGATLTSADHLAALAALELKAFSILACFDLTDSSILAAYASWTQSQEDANRPVRLVVGGAAGETIDTALARTVTLSNPHIVNVGVGTWHDDLLDKDLSTSQLAPRVAGILAAKGTQHAATYAKIGGVRAVGASGPPSDAVESAVQGGVLVFMQAAAADAEIRIAKGVTTFTSTTDAARPLDVFGDARLVGAMDGYIRDMKQWGDDIVIGDLPVNDDTRAQVRGHARQLQDALLRDGLILPGDDVTIPKPFVNVIDTDDDPALSDAIPYEFGWQFAQTANAILGEGQIR